MENADDVIYQGEFYKLNESRKRLIGTKSDSWKSKYLILYHKGDKPVLDYHKKKPKNGKKSERTLTDSFELWPSYKVEKLHNARGREFVCEITSTDFHIFLSADEEKQIDILVFFLQIQIRLKDNIKKESISVVSDDSDCQQKIGAKGSRCVLHASPWGLTLVLEETRALLAQWPLKSIRYYEASGAGNFSIEAGRVAPMGEGVFSFKTQPGDDGYMYDLVDSYIVNTLDRVKPTQKGTHEEIEDYIREHECLHSLTTIHVCSPSVPEIRNVLKRNWNIGTSAPEESTPVSNSHGHSSSPRHRGRSAQSSQSSSVSMSHPVQSTSLVVNLERPDENSGSRRNSADSRSVSGPHENSRVTVRPPPLPSRSSNGGGVPRRSQRRDHSIPRKVDVVGSKPEGSRLVLSESIATGTVTPSPKSRSSASSVISSVNHIGSALAVNPSVIESGNTAQHTEFYNLSSPNMKVRVSKSPIITKNPNKVGRAEHLLSVQESGVKSPVSDEERWDLKSKLVREDDQREAAEYLDAVSRASQSTYGGHNSVDRSWLKMRRDFSVSEQSTTSDYSCMEVPAVSTSLTHHRGYVNLENSPSRDIHHSRQRSAPETVSETSSPQGSRQRSRDSEQTLSPPRIRHKQRHMDEVSHESVNSLDPVHMSDNHIHSTGNTSRTTSAESSYLGTSISPRIQSTDSDVLELDVLRKKQKNDRKMSEFSGLESVDAPVGDWLMSASCEDLSDHMRTVIYDDNNNNGNNLEIVDIDIDEADSAKANGSHQTISSSGSMSSNDKPPLPFTGLKNFHAHTATVDSSRDRSKSFGYMNIPGGGSTQSKPQSSAPSAHLIRKMVNARAKQETLRKSLSNPNFLNLGSKEHLFTLKSNNGSTTKLAPQHKQKSRSFGNLFPAIKKALSRESLGHSRSTTPERRRSRSITPERRSSLSARRSSNDADSNIKRQSSFHSYGELTIKGIRMTERSRSFRRVKGSKSMEVLSRTGDENDVARLSSATTVSSPTTADAEIHKSSDDSSRTSTLSSMTEPPATDAPLASHNSMSSIQITQTISSLPPLPIPVQVPQKKTSIDMSSADPQFKKSINNLKGPSGNSSYQNASSNDQDKTSILDPQKSKRHIVSDIIANIEVNTADSKSLSRKQSRSHFIESTSNDINSRGPRTISTNQDNGALGSRRSSNSQRTSTNHVASSNYVVNSEFLKSEHQKSENSGQTSDLTEFRLSAGNQELQLGSSKANSTSGGDNCCSETLSDESKSKVLHTIPNPFQPIPFRRHQNCVRSVQAPTRLTKP